ncbi:PREDICTED: uncharacterized protein LOC105569959 isoform X2 [Vollenhovia emeryi]|uniref:uncharacterized protein LOC105569959 isoform X2 n=1 Tax=Vollenhovia emeryi TaxID=411798 RepID=UPI0005F3B496|nr:PREDICTED: uncharacterized protein LOC105569959 isoform X2 [Vollenhovia emeryi]
MAKSIGSVLLLTFALSFVRTDKHERWNTPPELTPESVKMLNNGEPETRLFSFNPTATVSLNAGNNNAHSVSLGASLDGISLSESNSYDHPTGSSISVSKSATVSAGLSGISTASAGAYNNGNNVKTESHSLSFGQATASSFGTIENGQAITGAASSAGISQISTTGGNGRQFSQANARYPYWPTWSNIGPSNGHNDQHFNRPTLTVSKPYDETRPTLNIGGPGIIRQEQKPTIHIYKWRPNHRVSRPGISIEHRIHDSRNGRTHGSTSLQIESKNSNQEDSDSDLISDLAQTVGELFDIE